MSNLSPTVDLLMKSGIVTKEMVRQLINWRLLPEDCVGLAGSQPVNLNSPWESLGSFIKTLKESLIEEMKSIRETELDHTGGFHNARVTFQSGKKKNTQACKLFIDRLNRVITPMEPKWEKMVSVRVGKGSFQPVVSRETRFKGDLGVAYVHYLEKNYETN